ARRALNMGGIAVAAAAVVLGAAYIYERSVVSDKRTELKDATARLTAVQAEAAPIHALEAQATAALTSARTISQSSTPWESVLTDFSRVPPTAAYLSTMSVTAPQRANRCCLGLHGREPGSGV